MRASLRNTGTLALLFALYAAPAQAQIGGFIKRAAQKAVEGKVQEKVEDATPVKPLSGDPVTEAALNGLLKGLSLELETQERTKQMATAIDAKEKEVNDAENAAGNEPSAWEDANRNVGNCISNSLDKSSAIHEKEMPGRVLQLTAPGKDNTALMNKIQSISKKMSEAQTKGDMDGYVKAMGEYMKLLGFDVQKDSLVAFAACGRPPAKPASLVKLERLKAEVDTLNERRRAAETESEARSAKAAGMPADQYALARERLWAWSDARRQKKTPRAITKEEDVLFSTRAADIKRVESLLR